MDHSMLGKSKCLKLFFPMLFIFDDNIPVVAIFHNWIIYAPPPPPPSHSHFPPTWNTRRSVRGGGLGWPCLGPLQRSPFPHLLSPFPFLSPLFPLSFPQPPFFSTPQFYSVLRIRIRIGSGFSTWPGSGFESGSGSRALWKTEKISSFQEIHANFLRFLSYFKIFMRI